MKTQWAMIRVSKKTHDDLVAVKDSMLRAAENGQVEFELDNNGEVSLGQVIQRLIDARKEHARRRRKARRNGKKETTGGDNPPVFFLSQAR